MKIYVYDRSRNRNEVYNRASSDSMPYARYSYLSVREFRGSSNHITIWTTKENMEAFNKLRSNYKKPIWVGYAFKSISEGGHGPQSQHYAGLAIDLGQKMSVSQRKAVYNLARKLGIYGYVEPITMTPTWVHVDTRYGRPACSSGFPTLQRGSRGNYVLTLQDALRYKFKISNLSLDGVFGSNTERAVRTFQALKGISQTGVVACKTWQALAA